MNTKPRPAGFLAVAHTAGRLGLARRGDDRYRSPLALIALVAGDLEPLRSSSDDSLLARVSLPINADMKCEAPGQRAVQLGLAVALWSGRTVLAAVRDVLGVHWAQGIFQ
jgi:hypothetical protein